MSKVRSKTVISVGVAIATLPLTLAVLCCSTVKPVVAQSETASCKDIPSCGVAGIIVGIQFIGSVTYYIVDTGHGVLKKIRAHHPSSTVHNNGEDYQEELITIKGSPGASTKCYEIAEERTRSTGKKWRVKSNKLMRGTGGVAQPGKLLDWECIITDAPEDHKAGE
ncbi:hypothetical protein G7B40_037980 [Aetokthonos hydrillicola Thurmond2011]|jgi:hypothetical protein|uniref:Uncharacterized protein n=1 Tax=Aetokthonos hydrillicola Thurmond2011 TaxID=2712845 RepID=A0AAP5IHJ0_9CYAN|nr:hypothetical protein [Aetokthonos hydrillicola]MBO3463100.1 hypothetical protein [Aetokthonos hydrillicola CCALA 1050]MDR9900298.1 hypothetical protein [Aetokthonos hydrillicola Thurmond2011]